jgi:hypothetical protein
LKLHRRVEEDKLKNKHFTEAAANKEIEISWLGGQKELKKAVVLLDEKEFVNGSLIHQITGIKNNKIIHKKLKNTEVKIIRKNAKIKIINK